MKKTEKQAVHCAPNANSFQCAKAMFHLFYCHNCDTLLNFLLSTREWQMST